MDLCVRACVCECRAATPSVTEVCAVVMVCPWRMVVPVVSALQVTCSSCKESLGDVRNCFHLIDFDFSFGT